MSNPISLLRIWRIAKAQLLCNRLYIAITHIIMIIAWVIFYYFFFNDSSIKWFVDFMILLPIFYAISFPSVMNDKRQLSYNYMLPASMKEKYFSGILIKLIVLLYGSVLVLLYNFATDTTFNLNNLVSTLFGALTFMVLRGNFNYGMTLFSLLWAILFIAFIVICGVLDLPTYPYIIAIVVSLLVPQVIIYRRLNQIEITQ